MPRPSLSEDQVRDRRDRILDVAQQLFENDGVEGVSLRRIAAGAGCSPATPYRYFPGIDHVLHGLRIRAFDAMRDTLAAAANAEPDVAARPRAIARAYMNFALERPETYALLFRTHGTAEDEPELARAKRDALGVCVDALAACEAGGHLRLRTDPLTAANLFWAAAHGVVSLHLGGQLVVGRTLDDLAPTLIATLMAGLSHSEAHP